MRASEQAQCASAAYTESGQPLYFALGTGGDGTGIDHLDGCGIFVAFEEAAVTCGIPIDEE